MYKIAGQGIVIVMKRDNCTFKLPLKYRFTREWNHCSTLMYCLASSIQGAAGLEAVASLEAGLQLSCSPAGRKASASDDSCASMCR